MGAEDFAESLIEQMSSGVVGFNLVTTIHINASHEFCFRILGKSLGEVDGKIIFALGVEDFHCFVLVDEDTSVTYLTTHFGVERSVIEYELKVGLLLLLHLTILQDAAAIFCVVPTMECGVTFCQNHPVACFCGSSVTSTLLLLLHFCIKTSLVYGETSFRTDELSEIEGETIGVEEGESILAINDLVACGLGSFDDCFQTMDTSGKCAEERFLFFTNHLGNQLLLRRKFGICASHLLNEGGNKAADEGFALIEEGVSIANCAAQDATNHITCFCV